MAGMIVRGIGVDIVDIARVKAVLARSGTRFVNRVYTDAEIEYCAARAMSAQHFAARFAAKEAVFKALGTGWSKGVGWKDVEVVNDSNGTPHVHLSGKALEIFSREGGGSILLSISHTGQMAVANVLWVQTDRPLCSPSS